MNTELLLVLSALAVVIAMFVIGRPRMDAVALLVLVTLPLTGIVTMNEALAGFADSSIVLIAALFVIGEGLVLTGVARRIGDWLDQKAAGSESRLVALLMTAAGGLGSLMSSTAVVAIFIPVVMRICQNRAMAPRRLMMSLSFAALISGMLTLIATAPNLMVSAELEREGYQGFSFFSFTPFGLPILVLGILYTLVARRLLGAATNVDVAESKPGLRQWIKTYDLAKRERRFRVSEGSPLIGKNGGDLSIAGVNLLAIERGKGLGVKLLRPDTQTTFQSGDILLADVTAAHQAVADVVQSMKLDERPLNEAQDYFADRSQEIGMVEVILPVESKFVGLSVAQANDAGLYGTTVAGLCHGRHVITGDLSDEILKIGDTLLLVGFWTDINRLSTQVNDAVILNLPAEQAEFLPAASRAPHAVLALTVVVVLMVSGIVPNVQAALIGCLLMGLFGCVDFNSAYRSINWKSLVLIVGMLPFSLALQRTGGVELAASQLIDLAGNTSLRLMLAILFAITAVVGLFISNTATAVLMAPVAIAIARDLGVSPYPFAMTVALAASAAFMTPISSPVNTLVVGPGQYSFGDFVKVGVPFTIVVAIVSTLIVPVLLPF